MCDKMKKTFKFLVLAMAVCLIMALTAFSSSAAESAKRVDPTTLQPTGERVVFIKDAPEGGKLSGDGSGVDADNPYIPIDHEQFDPSADAPQNHLQTAFYQATELLMDEGGTIVICGPVHFGVGESYGSGGTTKDVFTAKWGTKKVIKFTSVYNGVDYRETAGAKITIETPAEIGVLGSSIWENIDIETKGMDRVISFASCPTLIGEGVNCYPSDEAYKEVATNYVSLSGGHRYARGDDQIPTLTVQSGTYNKVVGALWGVSTGKEMTNATVYLTLEGTTKVLGVINGSIGKNTDFSGHVNLTINAGTYECDIYGVGPTGMTNSDGTLDIVINGGDFSNAWSLSECAPGFRNNAPATVTLDFMNYTGDSAALSQILDLIPAGDFEDIKIPDSFKYIPPQVVDTEPEATRAVETPKETEGATDSETTVAEDGDESASAPTDNEDPAESDSEKVDKEPEGSDALMITLIIVIVVSVAIIGTLSAIIFIKLKKK